MTALVLASCSTVPPTATSPEPASASQTAAQVAGTDEARRVDEMFAEYFEELLRRNPLLATSIGDHRYNDTLAITISEDYRAKEQVFREKYLKLANELDSPQLDAQRRLSLELFREKQKDELELLKFPSHLLPINQFYNFGSSFAQLGSGRGLHPFKTVKDYKDFLSRARDFERWVDTAIANMNLGLALKIVQPRILIEKSIPQLDAHVVEDPRQSIFWEPIRNMPKEFSAADREHLEAAYREVISTRIVPSYRTLRDYLRDRYLSHTRDTVGLSALPGGDAWYARLVEATTTTEMTPAEVHQIGLAEVARIQKEMNEVKERAGFEGTLEEFFDFLKNDPRFYYATPAEILQGYKDLKASVDASTAKLFDVKPKSDYEIRPVEPFRERTASSGSYQAASTDGSRPGIFYLNTFDPKARPKFAMESLLLHEGSPGHHFQISLQRELESLPRFRRFGSYTAYVEGWGLYAESLGKELGFYADPYSDYGRLDAELWRAIRLVLDTGIHAKGWSRQEAIDYALKNSSIGETRATAEVDRFIAIPSQALAYKIGQLKITELRRRAEQKLGPAFDIKEFHRQVLESGALPLDVLETKIDAWIADRLERGATAS